MALAGSARGRPVFVLAVSRPGEDRNARSCAARSGRGRDATTRKREGERADLAPRRSSFQVRPVTPKWIHWMQIAQQSARATRSELGSVAPYGALERLLNWCALERQIITSDGRATSGRLGLVNSIMELRTRSTGLPCSTYPSWRRPVGPHAWERRPGRAPVSAGSISYLVQVSRPQTRPVAADRTFVYRLSL